MMMIRKGRRQVPLVNSTSTADISFILLVFFLVITSMDIDKGLLRQLPSAEEGESRDLGDIARENVMSLGITASGEVLRDGEPVDIARLRGMAMDFIVHAPDREQHVIALDVDRAAPYEAYFNVQNELMAAYGILRDGYAVRTFGRAYGLCTREQREKVRAHYPQRIAEVQAAREGEDAE